MSEPIEVTLDLLRSMPLPVPARDSDKEDRGRVMVVGGSHDVPGALRLAGEAALRAGAGKLQLAGPSALTPHLGLLIPEARVFALAEEGGEIAPEAAAHILPFVSKCDAVLIGPGMMAKPAAEGLTAALLESAQGPGFVIDAAAMAGCWENPHLVHRHKGRVILTPHAGEMAGLTGASKESVQNDPLGAASAAARKLNAVVVLKGEHTYIARPDGRGWVHDGKAVGLATSGSGDVLGGVITGLLARGASPVEAALWGVYVHGRAGVRLSKSVGQIGFLARELVGEIPAILTEAQ